MIRLWFGVRVWLDLALPYVTRAISQFAVSKHPNDPMYHRLSNMNIFFSEAFEYNYSQHSIE